MIKICEHSAMLFFKDDFTFRCEECREVLVRLSGIEEFRLFCEFTGKDPKELLA